MGPTTPARPPQPRVPVQGGATRHGPALSRWLLVVALLAAAVYLNGIPGAFVFDDKLIQRDPRINGQESFWTIFVTDYWYKYIGTSADLYRPLTIASYALNRMVAGLHPPAFHLVNIALHAAASVVVVLLVKALLGGRRLAVVAGLLFALHPVHTEAVTGIVGRAEVLSALFLLVALTLQACDYTLSGRGRSVWMPVGLLAYFCALLSKETAIVGPGLAAIVDYVVQGRQPTATEGESRQWAMRRTLGRVALYAGVALVYLVIRYAIVGRFLQKAPPRSYTLLFGQPLAMRVFTALEILAIYMRLLFFPATLSADYSYRQIPLLDAPNGTALVGLFVAVALVGSFVWAVRRRAWPAICGLGFFGISYSIVGNFPVPLQVLVAERLLYLPSVGFCIGIAWLWVGGVDWAARRGGLWRRVPYAVLAVVLVLYATRTVVRNFDWRDPETIYAATVRASPDCFAARFNYSAILLSKGKTQEALDQMLTAYAVRNDFYPLLVNLASVYVRLGQPEQARNIAVQGLRVRPDGREIKAVLAEAERQLGQR